MKKYLLLTILFLTTYIPDTFSQAGQWTWMKGSNTTNSAGVYGVQGTPNTANTPPGMYEAVEWTDKNGNFWLFSGLSGVTSEQSDLWKYDPLANAWTWVKGPGTGMQPGVYGTKGVPSVNNNPGARSWGSPTWVDTAGNLWLYGGIGYSSTGGHTIMNDLWKYDIGANEWTWMAGNDTGVYQAVYGSQCVLTPTNDPGNRAESDASWTDRNGNLWMFGGLIYHGYTGNWSVTGTLSDLWEYNMSTNQWAWIKGPQGVGAPGVYGTIGVPNVNNYPPSRESYNKWIDDNCDLWLFGGVNYNTGHKFNDLWRYNIASNTWTWMSGSNIPNDSVTATQCSPSTTIMPEARHESRASYIDACGNFWLMGGSSPNPGNICMNDFWKYNPKTNEWTLVSGQNGGGTPAFNYGTQGVSSASNVPPGRMGDLGWLDKSGNFWVWGGTRGGLGMNQNDLWRFIPDTACTGSCKDTIVSTVPCSAPCTATVVPPVAAFSSSDSTFCAGDCISFNNLSINSSSWLWTFQGALPSSSTSQSPQFVCYTDSGSFSVTLIAYNGNQSDTAKYNNLIKVYAAPVTPNIIQSHDTLFCSIDSSYKSYQWYKDSTLIDGATSANYVFSQTGNYNIRVSGKDGCSIAAGITVVGIKEFSTSGLGFTLSPNPATNELFINSARAGSLFGKGKLKIYDALGKVCLQSEIINPKSVIDVSSLSQGIYFVEIQVDAAQWIGKFFKE